MRSSLLAIPAAIAAFTISAAWATVVVTTDFSGNTAPSGAHYGNTGPGQPTCSVAVDGFTVNCGGTVISGVGNIDADVVVSVSYSGTVTCTNHGGQTVEVKTTTQSTTVLPDRVTTLKNGTMTVAGVTFGGDPTAALKANAACPNGNWTKDATNMALVSFSYRLIFDGFAPNAAITITGP
jgi:hypothetical protein